MRQIKNVVQVQGPNKWLILGVSVAHLLESSDLFFLEAGIVYNIFHWKYAADKKCSPGTRTKQVTYFRS